MSQQGIQVLQRSAALCIRISCKVPIATALSNWVCKAQCCWAMNAKIPKRSSATPTEIRLRHGSLPGGSQAAAWNSLSAAQILTISLRYLANTTWGRDRTKFAIAIYRRQLLCSASDYMFKFPNKNDVATD